MRDKHFYQKKTAILISIYAFVLLAIGTGSYVTMAWFSSTRTAEVNFASLKLSEGFSVNVRYLSYNSHTEGSTSVYDGYRRDDIAKLDASFSYADNFLPVSDTSVTGPLANHYFAPLYASTYCFEVTFDGADVGFNVYLGAFSSPASTTEYSDTLSSYIALSEAIDVYTSYSDGTNLDADAKSFLEATTGDQALDRFSHTDSGGSGLTENWDPSSSMTIPSGGKGYFFVTIYFSNASSTLYSPVSGSASHWTQDPNSGNSNPYQNLSITFTNVILDMA